MRLIAAAIAATTLALAAPAFADETAGGQKSETVTPPAPSGASSEQKAAPAEEPAGTGASSGEAGRDDDPTPGNKSRVEGTTRQQKGL